MTKLIKRKYVRQKGGKRAFNKSKQNKNNHKEEESNICWDALFYNPFFCSMPLIKIQKSIQKNGASQQTFGPSYFVRASNSMNVFLGFHFSGVFLFHKLLLQ